MNNQVFNFLKENEGKDYRMVINHQCQTGTIGDVYFKDGQLYIENNEIFQYGIELDRYTVRVNKFKGNIILTDNSNQKILLYIEQPSFLDTIHFNIESNNPNIGFIEEQEFFSKIKDQMIYIKGKESLYYVGVDKLIGKDFEELVNALLFGLDNPLVTVFRHGDIVIVKGYGRRNGREIEYKWVVR